MIAYIIGIIALSFILVVVYTHKYKNKDGILPILSVLIYILLSKILRQLFNLNTTEVTLLSVLYLFLLALLLKIFVSNK
jgi:hypothetical protein